jgi:hypothetical protein
MNQKAPQEVRGQPVLSIGPRDRVFCWAEPGRWCWRDPQTLERRRWAWFRISGGQMTHQLMGIEQKPA